MRYFFTLTILLWCLKPILADSSKVWLSFDPTPLPLQELHLGVSWIKMQKPHRVKSLKLVYIGHGDFLRFLKSDKSPRYAEGTILHYETQYLLGKTAANSPYLSTFLQSGYLNRGYYGYEFTGNTRRIRSAKQQVFLMGIGYKVGWRLHFSKYVATSVGLGAVYREFSRDGFRSNYYFSSGSSLSRGTTVHFNLDFQFRIS